MKKILKDAFGGGFEVFVFTAPKLVAFKNIAEVPGVLFGDLAALQYGLAHGRSSFEFTF